MDVGIDLNAKYSIMCRKTVLTSESIFVVDSNNLHALYDVVAVV